MPRAARDQEFTEYVVQRRQWMRRVAYLLCGDVDRAEDLVQTALMKVYTAWWRVSRYDNVDAYVRRVLVNSTIDESRRPWRREEPGLGGIDRPDRELFAAEDRMAIMAALAALSAGQRRVVVLRYYLGLSVEETAADLDITPSTVKSQCSRGLARLNELLTAQFRA
jgi:RNA polymerase sigma-70 factor (sigma-E family)